MSEQEPTLRDVWRLLASLNTRLGDLNTRMGNRFDVVERQLVAMDARIGALDAKVIAGFGALKESIEARDFRLDDHGRRLSALEEPVR